MLIANPIYDSVFKYLLEDMEIAREFLSLILNEDIVSIEVKPQERISEEPDYKLRILRFDFKAVIRTSEGELKNVLMELQKARESFEITRFRKYLSENYNSLESVQNEGGETEKWVLPIVSIYFLGFKLDKIHTLAFKVNREYRDMITGEVIHQKEDFAEHLTHDCYIIQLPELVTESRTRLEKVLQLFNQRFRMNDNHYLQFEPDSSDPLVDKMVKRLSRAAGDEKMRYQMDFEDEYEMVTTRNKKKIEEEKDKIIAERELQIKNEQRRADEEQRRADEEQRRADEEQRRADEEQRRADESQNLIAELQKRISDLEKRMTDGK